jgi:hypothetical protein
VSCWPLSSSAKVGVGTKKTTGPHDHSTTAAPSGCHVIDVPFTGATEKARWAGNSSAARSTRPYAAPNTRNATRAATNKIF